MWGAGCVSAEAGEVDERAGAKAADPGWVSKGQAGASQMEGDACIQVSVILNSSHLWNLPGKESCPSLA